ncbi:MAG: APC family permease [Halobacteria archaeon]|nr:APC family permease [Halobacteria archaeon]
MAKETLGLTEGVSIALGGMIGGGIFAVLGVVAQITHAATWFAFVLAGVVALCAAYSFNKLNKLSDGQGGAVTFIQCFLGNSNLAGMAGWTLLFGYIGSMAMYAYAFGSFTVGLALVPDSVAGYPLRPAVSVIAVGAFVVLNLVGAQATGSAENILVGGKVAILLVLGIGGIYYGFNTAQLEYGISSLTSFSPIMAAGISFVAFQGWQLLFYDQESFKNPIGTIRKAVYISVLSAVGIYIIVAVTTVSLAPLSVIKSHPERALAVAADPFIPYGFTIISLAALLSTGSAINATLFSSGYFTKGMLSDDLVPDQVGEASASGVPTRTVLLLGVVVSAFTAYGTLGAITSFASLTFIIVFGAMSYLAFRQRDQEEVNPVVPSVGIIGATGFFLLMFWHLFQAERNTFYAVLLIAFAVVAVETLYFKRETLEEEVATFVELIEEETPEGVS